MCFCAETHVWSSNSFLCPLIFHISEWADRARCDGLCLAPPPSPASHLHLISLHANCICSSSSHSLLQLFHLFNYLFILTNFNFDFLSKMKSTSPKKCLNLKKKRSLKCYIWLCSLQPECYWSTGRKKAVLQVWESHTSSLSPWLSLSVD